MKTVLFVPGFQEDIQSRDYQKTIDSIKNAGYSVEFVTINWVRTTINDWVKELNTMYEKYDPENTILAGFSFGAMTAFVSATSRNPSELWLFSLSPYFNEDITSSTFRKSWLNHIGHRRTDTFRQLCFQQLLQGIDVKTYFFYGEAELKNWSDIEYRYSATSANKNFQTVLIPGAEHDVSSNVYVAAIKSTISSVTT